MLGETVLLFQHLRFVELQKKTFVGILIKLSIDTSFVETILKEGEYFGNGLSVDIITADYWSIL